MNFKLSVCTFLLIASFSVSSYAQGQMTSDASQSAGADTAGQKKVLIIGANGRTSAEIIPRLRNV